MKIGVIVYSHSSHTLSVATKLKDKLSEAGHEVTLEQIETVVPLQRSDTTAELKTKPSVAPYDALVFGTPVRGGLPAPPMRVYLEQLTSLEDKKVACLATGFFRTEWGRDQTLAKMKTLCESKGATVIGAGSVKWSSLSRKRQISEAVESLSQLF